MYFHFLTIILPEHALKSQNLTSIIRWVKLKPYDNKNIYKKGHIFIHVTPESTHQIIYN